MKSKLSCSERSVNLAARPGHPLLTAYRGLPTAAAGHTLSLHGQSRHTGPSGQPFLIPPRPPCPWHLPSFPLWAVPCSGAGVCVAPGPNPADVTEVRALLALRLHAPRSHAQHTVTQAELVALTVSPGKGSCLAWPGRGAMGAHGSPLTVPVTQREAEAGGDCRTDLALRDDGEHLTESSPMRPPRPSPPLMC